MTPRLPSPLLETAWVDVTPGDPVYTTLVPLFERAVRQPGWHPKTCPLPGNRLVFDLCAKAETGELGAYHVAFDVVDHPLLARLPNNAPRAVKHIYRRDTRAKYLRMTEAWDFMGDMDRADAAWDDYCEQLPEYIRHQVEVWRRGHVEEALSPPDPDCPWCRGTGRVVYTLPGYSWADDTQVAETCSCRRRNNHA